MSDTVTPGAAVREPTPGTPAGDTSPAASSAPVETVTEVAPVPTAEPVVAEAAPVVETVVEPVTETVETKPSLIAEAKAEEPTESVKPEEPKADEKPADQPEDKPEEKPEAKAEEKPAEPLPPPVYDKYTLPEGLTLNDERLGQFNGMLGEIETKIAADPSQAHAAMQDLGQRMVSLYIDEMKAGAERVARFNRENWDRTREQWATQVREDADIGKNRIDTTLSRVGALIDMYGSDRGPEAATRFRDAATLTGMGDHPEMVRFVNWAATRLVETRKIVPAAPSKPSMPASPAQRLYGKTTTMRSA